MGTAGEESGRRVATRFTVRRLKVAAGSSDGDSGEGCSRGESASTGLALERLSGADGMSASVVGGMPSFGSSESLSTESERSGIS